MTPQLSLLNINQSLDGIKRIEQDLEYWSARELMPLLGYTTWRMFGNAIERAKESCKKSDQSIKYHFVGADKMIPTGKGATRIIEDVLMTRYACYLVAQNGDPRKPAEKNKILCGKKHFELFDDLVYKAPVKTLSDVLN